MAREKFLKRRDRRTQALALEIGIGNNPNIAQACYRVPHVHTHHGNDALFGQFAQATGWSLCAEKDPLTCHRTILVCRHLIARGAEVQHILEDGTLESHANALDRLLAEEGMAPVDLFQTRDEIIAEAYQQRGQQIAYTKRTTKDPREEWQG